MKTFVAPLLTSDGRPIRSPSGPDICWLDEFFGGQIAEARDLGRPLVALLAGPPGAGKSLLVQQICYNLARRTIQELAASRNPKDQFTDLASSLIITTEVSALSLIDNMNRLGLVQGTGPAGSGPSANAFCVYQVLPDDDSLRTSTGKWPLLLLADALEVNGQPPSARTLIERVTARWNAAWERSAIIPGVPFLVAIDSLNVLSDFQDRKQVFDALVPLFNWGPRVLLLVLDTPKSGMGLGEAYQACEFRADLSIRLDYDYGEDDYLGRRLEIVKTRLQGHTMGKQVAKIFPKPERNDPEDARPSLHAGGLFVFPSLHYVLSKVRQSQKLVDANPRHASLQWASRATQGTPEQSGPGNTAPPIGIEPAPSGDVPWTSPIATLNWPVQWCFELVGGGIPVHQCTALVGRRGARKSYFGYQFLLDGIKNDETTMVISFRDNPDAVRQTLDRIGFRYGWTSGLPRYPAIVYQRPGYVTAEEFMHRIIAAVGERAPTRVLVNAIDQWEAAYPLLTRSTILVQTLIEFLNSHQATSLVVGVGDKNTRGSYGLTAKAEVVLSFEYRRLPWQLPLSKRASIGLVADAFPEGVPLVEPPGGSQTQPKVVVRAERVPRGGAGFGRAVLENISVSGRLAGLDMLPLSPEFPEGELI